MKTTTHLVSLTTVLTFSFASLADDWPQWMGPRRDGVWRETGGRVDRTEKESVTGLTP